KRTRGTTSQSARTTRSLLSPTARSRSETESSAASTCTSCRQARTNRNGHRQAVPLKGRPGRDLTRSRPKGRRGRPERAIPFFFFLLPKLSPAVSKAAGEEKDDVCKDRKTAASARLSGRRARACGRDRPLCCRPKPGAGALALPPCGRA